MEIEKEVGIIVINTNYVSYVHAYPNFITLPQSVQTAEP